MIALTIKVSSAVIQSIAVFIAMLSVIGLSVVMLNVVAPKYWRNLNFTVPTQKFGKILVTFYQNVWHPLSAIRLVKMVLV